MSSPILAQYVNPWKYRREQQELQRVVAVRQRDGDECRRCRRPIRFDLKSGHDLGPKIEDVLPTDAEAPDLANLCLTHRRCNAESADVTWEVVERVKRKNEAELFAKSRKRA